MPNIFIIGSSRSGKTTLAKTLQDSLSDHDPRLVSAGTWARSTFGDESHTADSATSLAEKTRQALDKNPCVVREWLVKQTKTCRPVIIEGIRNPIDFAGVWNPAEDVVVFLTNPAPSNAWEATGIETIRRTVDWGAVNGGCRQSLVNPTLEEILVEFEQLD